LAVREGAARPGIATEAALREAVASARTIGYSTGPSGNHLLALLERWGLKEALAGRLVQAPPGVPVAQLVARGDAELGLQQMPELAGQPGITVLGALPGAAAQITTFSAALGAGTANADAARAVLGLFNDDAAAAIKRRCGLEPCSP
jgi:molybdate transport system substrate-binding protein